MNECSCSDGLCTDCAMDMREAIRNVLKLHRPVTHRGLQVCEACTPPDILMQTKAGRGRPGVEHPCATEQSLGGAASLRD